MADPLINIGALATPATRLIEKISEGIEGLCKPWQIKRVAQAEACAELTNAETRIKITEIERRAVQRLIQEEGRKQENIEKITQLAIEHLEDDAKPEDIDNDWIAYFFDKSRLVSNEQMQILWARILAGEANAPGLFSRQTISLVASIDKDDAELFTKLCKYVWNIGGIVPVIYGYRNTPWEKDGLGFEELSRLGEMGLIHYHKSSTNHFEVIISSTKASASYQNKLISIEFLNNRNSAISVGNVLLTRPGEQLFSICSPSSSNEYFEHILNHWRGEGLILSSPLNQIDNSKN